MTEGVIVFDMDGVLVDVTASYREAIRQTVEHFTGMPVNPGEIQDYKNAGGWNNDWALSHRICLDREVAVEYDNVVEHFQRIFLGNNFNGLIQREQWIPRGGLLEDLELRFRLAIFTGRERAEAFHTLQRFAPTVVFQGVLGDEDVAHKKPHPEGLQRIAAMYPGEALTYVGDTVDDARSAKAAGVRFLGVADPGNPRAAELRALLIAEGAEAVAANLNELEPALYGEPGVIS
ncbi:MAG: HAD family hydrolase [Bryobacterales bacterium]|nr:HAD family hydrolase [Bryobacterales bacterium]